jgi:ABC-type transport system involved in cytochrome c biogenesis ATPase subunit
MLLQMHDLAFAYPGCPLWAHWSHAWGPGVALVRGGDGAGKTTLLRLLAGQLAPTQGRLLLQGVDAAAQPEAYRRQVFWIDPRLPGLPAHDGQTPAQWLQSLPAHYPQWSDAALQAHVQGWSLAQHLDKPFHALSSGTQRKIFMAAALASGAPLTLIDEPVAGLDKPSVNYLADALNAVAHAPARLVLVAHYESLPGVPWDAVADVPQ